MGTASVAVGMVAVGMVAVGMVAVGMVAVGSTRVVEGAGCRTRPSAAGRFLA